MQFSLAIENDTSCAQNEDDPTLERLCLSILSPTDNFCVFKWEIIDWKAPGTFAYENFVTGIFDDITWNDVGGEHRLEITEKGNVCILGFTNNNTTSDFPTQLWVSFPVSQSARQIRSLFQSLLMFMEAI